MKRVQILLSSYKGQSYIEEQINSILTQVNVDIHILIRDDGSDDDTIPIIKKYNDPRITIIEGQNIGATKSFFELIRISGDAEYYAFSDQDDVWDSDKLISAIDILNKFAEIPAIYSSNTRLVDKQLQFLKNENKSPNTTLGSALIKNYATGCTIVFNHELMKYLKRNTNIVVPYHDWWVNLVALSIGGVSLYDNTPHISYRQHDNNVVGSQKNFFKKWTDRAFRYRTTQYHRDLMAKELIRIYHDKLDDKSKDILNIFADEKSKVIDFLRNRNIKTSNTIDNIMFFILVVTNKL